MLIINCHFSVWHTALPLLAALPPPPPALDNWPQTAQRDSNIVQIFICLCFQFLQQSEKHCDCLESINKENKLNPF